VNNVIDEEGLVAQGTERGKYLMGGMAGPQNCQEQNGDVRGKGLLVRIELVEDRTTKKPADALGVAVGDECLRRGLSMNIVRSTGGMLNCFRMAPPLSITESEIDIALGIIDDALTAVLASRSRQILPNN